MATDEERLTASNRVGFHQWTQGCLARIEAVVVAIFGLRTDARLRIKQRVISAQLLDLRAPLIWQCLVGGAHISPLGLTACGW